MKKKLFILNCKKILHKLFFVDRFKVNTKEKGNLTVCPCQKLITLRGDMNLIAEQLEKLNSRSCQTPEVKVENINVEKVVLESLSFELGNIDVDAINGTMNIGITVNLQSGALSLPEKIKVSNSPTNKSNPALSFGKQIGNKKATYQIRINSNSSTQEITPEIIRTDNNKKTHSFY